MKILFVCDHVFLTKNKKVYSNTFSYNILKRYVDVFSNVTVLARNLEVDDTPDMLLASGEGVSFVFLESISTVSSFFGLRQQHEKTIEKLIVDYDGVIVRLPSELGLLTAKIANKIHRKCLTEVVGCAWDAMWNYGGLRSKVYAPFLFLKMKNSVKKAEYASYVTEQFLQKRYIASKMIAISDVELPDTDEEILLKRVKKIENLGKKIVFGTIANLNVQYKGIDIALQILSNIVHDYPDFEYRIIGAGDSKRYRVLADRLGIGDKVFFDGVLSGGKAVFDWLDSINIYLQPSLVEGLPRALVEAMSRGCPAIGSSVGGIPELLDENMVFSHRDSQKFYEIIERLMHDKKWMLEVAENNFKRAKKYQKSVLYEKRNKFLIDFKDDLLKARN